MTTRTAPFAATVRVCAMPQVSFRADPADAALLARIGEALAAVPPTAPNTVAAASDGQGHVLWLGPDEWLVVAREGARVRCPPPRSKPPSARPPPAGS